MTLPTKQIDVWSPASQEDKIKALVLLAGLPAREAGDAQVDKAAYYIALDGVTRHGLGEAVKFILKGALGHTFFPSPVEIRLQCDKAMEWHDRERARIAHQERLRAERIGDWPEPSPEAKARVARAYAAFCDGYKSTKAAEDGPKLDPELVAKVPDGPSTSDTFKRPKVA